MDIFEQYPELAAELDRLIQTRRNEILQSMVETDNEYGALRRARAESSALLLGALSGGDEPLQAYADAVFAQECYELDAVYRQGFTDAVEMVAKLGLR